MVKLVKGRSLTAFSMAVLLGLLILASVPVAWMASHSHTTAHSSNATAQARKTPTLRPGETAVQLAEHELTPSSHFDMTLVGFASGEQVALTVTDADGNTYDAGNVKAGADGQVTTSTVAPPPSLADGTYQLVAVGSTSHRRATTTFGMHDNPPLVEMEAYTGFPGQSVHFLGSGFFPGEKVTVSLVAPNGGAKTPLATANADTMGAVSGNLKIPDMAAGNYTLSLVGNHSKVPVTVGFAIQGYSAWVVLDRYAPTPGQAVGFIGHGFAPSEQVFVYLNTVQSDPIMRMQADTAGQVTVQDTWVPSGGPGDYMLILVGQSSKAQATAKFSILQAPAQQPDQQPPAQAPAAANP
jgi:hypothetical protein